MKTEPSSSSSEVNLIDTPLKALMECYFAGEWGKDPDGGVCSAMRESYELGKKETADQMGTLCLEWHFALGEMERRLEEVTRMRDQLLRSEDFAWKEIERLKAEIERLKFFFDD